MKKLAWTRLLIDILLWPPAIVLAQWARLDAGSVELPLGNSWFFLIAFAMIATHAVVGLLTNSYTNGVASHVGRVSALKLGASALAAMLVGSGLAVMLYPHAGVPRSVPVIAASLVVCFGFMVRAGMFYINVWRTDGRTPVIIYGASAWGRRLIAEIAENPESRYTVRAVLDAESGRRGGFLYGVRIAGGLEKLAEAKESTGATMLLVSESGTGDMSLGEVLEAARRAGIRLKVMPPIDQLGGMRLSELGMDDVAELMGRDAVSMNEASIASLIGGKRVLVTGAGGSIGAELCRQVARFAPGRLIMLDRDGGGLHHAQLSLTDQALLYDGHVVLSDLRDPASIRRVFERHRPELVFHAAALKHQPLLERFPREAWATNVVGTNTVLEASAAVGADVVVNVSTDKAANSCCVLGDSKRVAERLTAARGVDSPGKWVSVRFGNVFGSRRSVVETFTGQIDRGDDLTIMDPEVRRYFMTLSEAAQLVLQAAVVGRSGETLVLDMGEPMLIEKLARGLMAVAGRNDLQIRYTVLRAGEKMSEELFDDREEPIHADRHQMLSEVTVTPLFELPELVGDGQHQMGRLARPSAAVGSLAEQVDSGQSSPARATSNA